MTDIETIAHIESPPASFAENISEGCPILIALSEEIDAQRELPALTPEQIDKAIEEYEAAEATLAAERAVHADLRKTLIALVKAHGNVPPHAEQSIRLMGKRNIATVTTGTINNVNQDAVEQLLEFLENYFGSIPGANLFKQIFIANTKYQLVEGARTVLGRIQVPKRAHEKVLSLFGRCIDPRPKAPSLKVELIVPEKPARRPRAGKAAA